MSSRSFQPKQNRLKSNQLHVKVTLANKKLIILWPSKITLFVWLHCRSKLYFFLLIHSQYQDISDKNTILEYLRLVLYMSRILATIWKWASWRHVPHKFVKALVHLASFSLRIGHPQDTQTPFWLKAEHIMLLVVNSSLTL